MNPQVTIILSCFKADELIKGYIEALLHQEITNKCTLLAVNFPFSHKDPQFVEKQLKRYPDLKLITLDQNVSLYEAWNIGCRVATTKYVGNLNLDDRVIPDYYSYGVDVLEKNNGDLFSSAAILTSKIGEVSQDAHYERLIGDDRYFGSFDVISYSLPDLVRIEHQRLVKKSIPHCAPIWKKEVHKELGYFDSQKFDFGADTEFWLRMASCNKTMLFSKSYKILFYHAKGTASDRLMHPENEAILSKWSKTFPPLGYKESKLGKRHDWLQHCINMNLIFSSEAYYSHLKENYYFQKIWKQVKPILDSQNSDNDSGLKNNQVYTKNLDRASYRELERFHDLHRGQEAILLCNGPSLNQVDFSRIDKSRFVIFGLNKIFLGIQKLGIHPDYMAAVNPKVISQSAQELARIPIPKFISNRSFSSQLQKENNTFYIKTTPLPSEHERFSENITKYVHEGWTVTHVALQILYYMGIKTVYIVGMDHKFKQHVDGKENSESTIKGQDIDHFDPSYFGGGQSWDLPDLANSEISYCAALEAFQKANRKIYDCTINGACQIFPKLNIEKLYTKPPAFKAPKLSIIMPAFNSEQYISTAIQSVIQQSFGDWELLIVDDGSTDSTLKIANQVSSLDNRIKVVPNSRSKGVSGARNTGIEYACGEYLTFLDSDDFLYKDSLSSRIRILERNKKVNACFCAIEFVNESGKSLGVVLSKSKCICYQDFWKCPLQMTTPIIKSNVIGNLKFDENLTNGEDFLFLSELAKKINIFIGTTEIGVAYRVHPQSSVISQYYSHEEKLEEVYTRVYASYNDPGTGPESKHKGKWPDLNSVLRERKLNRLLWANITLDKQRFISLMQDSELASLVNKQPIEKLYNLVNHKLPFLTLRYSGCSLNSYKKVLQRLGVFQFVSDTEIYRLAPNLCFTINKLIENQEWDYDLKEGKSHSLKIITGILFQRLSKDRWRYIDSNEVRANEPKLWQAVLSSLDSDTTLGRTYVSGVCLSSNKTVTVKIVLGRYGSTKWEETHEHIHLHPNVAQSIQLRQTFTKKHEAIKLQLEVVKIEGDSTVDLTFNNVYLIESLTSFQQHLAENEINFPLANRLFREGHYQAAMNIYLLLHQKRPLPLNIYTNNALMAARKLGIDSIQTIDELIQRIH